MTLFACLQAAAFVGPLTYPQQPETPQDGGVCVWVHICGCGCVWSPPQTNPKREGTAPYPPPYIVPTILYITWALNTFAPSGAAQSCRVVGGRGCWISTLVFKKKCLQRSCIGWHPTGAAPKGSYGGSSGAAHKRDPGGWLGPPLKGPRKSAAPWMQASRLNNGRNPHTLNRLSHNLLLSSFSGS